MVQNFRSGPMWVLGVVTKQLGSLTFLITLRNGQRCKGHMDHLQRYQHGELDVGDQQYEKADISARHEPVMIPNTATVWNAIQTGTAS